MGTITILPETPKDPLALIGRRAAICWNADITNEEKNIKRGIDCIKSGHGRTLEFVDVHMIIDGFSARELFPAIENALKDYSEQWVWIVNELFKPKCEVTGYCDETKSCGKKPKREE